MQCVTQSSTMLVMAGSDFPKRKFQSRRRRRKHHHSTGNQKSNAKNFKTASVINHPADIVRWRAREFLEYANRTSNGLILSCRKSWDDLRAGLVIVSHGDQDTVIAVRRSSFIILGRITLFIVVLVLAFKLLRKLGLRLGFWEKRPKAIVRRDRSLGGREVLVGYSSSGSTSLPKSSSEGGYRLKRNLLSKKDLQWKGGTARPLPGWWSPPDGSMPRVSGEEYKAALSQIDSLHKVILEKGIQRKEFSKEEIVQLQELCKATGVIVSFGDISIRDSFYRAAINLVLTACTKGTGSSFVGAEGKEAAQFLAGLAESIRIVPVDAVTMINAAVAGYTHSSFLQSWDLIMQGKNEEAEKSFQRLSQIYSALPQDCSPEMEMVGSGLKRHLTLDARKQLFKKYSDTCTSLHQSVVAKALGLK